MRILNVSFSVRQPDGQMLPAQLLQERVHLNRNLLNKLSTLQVLQFDDNLCVREPCLNFEECVTVLKFGNASGFVASATMLFRPIYPVTTFACRCPKGFIGRTEHYLCDTEVNLCYSNPCMNGGDCKQAEGGFTCVCKPGFTGVPPSWSFNGEGQLIFNPLLRPIQLPWETHFSIRTVQTDCIVMAISIGQNSTATFS
ncbi:unnamed protein product, partial [Nesidiocoris tenuis]